MTDAEVSTLTSEEDAYMRMGNLEEHVNAVKTKSVYIENTEKYLQTQKTIPGKEFMSLEVHDQFFGS